MLCFYITNDVAAEYKISDGFETQAENWETNNSSIQFKLDTDTYKEGSQSARIQNDSTSTYGIEHIVTDITPNTYYEIIAYVKTSNPPPLKAVMRVAWYESTDGSGSQIKTTDSDPLTVQADWTELSIRSTSPENAHSAKIRLLVSSGLAYFDSVSLQEAIEPTLVPTIIASTATPTAIVQPQETISHIFISEVMVYPEAGESEWIELYNNNNFDVILENWYTDDISDGGGGLKQFSLTIPAHGFASYELSSALFNNGGDTVRLLDVNKNEIDSFSYSESKKGYSIGKDSSNHFCIQNPSQNAPNNACIEEILDEELESTITISPTVIQNNIIGLNTQVTQKPTPTHIVKFISKPIASPTSSAQEEQITNIESLPEQDSMRIKPWLLLSGSYSTLAFVSLVSKLIFLR